jgi:release factor glutamine methyltransferase
VRLIEVIQRSTAYLQERGIESPRLQVELLLAQLLGVQRLGLYLEFEKVLSTPELDHLREAIRRRGRREPLQHILGTVVFCGFEMEVAPCALIPRPETELLAERAWSFLAERGAPATMLDWGTGTGCLAIAVAGKVSTAQVVGLDISSEAVSLAQRNAARHGFGDRIRFVLSDGCAALAPTERFDLIVSNPPYIPTSAIETLEPEVRDHDPRLALDGGSDGLDFYRRLATELSDRLQPEGGLLLEFGDHQGPAVSEILAASGWDVVERHADLSGRDRFLFARRAS